MIAPQQAAEVNAAPMLLSLYLASKPVTPFVPPQYLAYKRGSLGLHSHSLVERSNPTSHLTRAELWNTVYRVPWSPVVIKMTFSMWTRRLPIEAVLVDAYNHVTVVQMQQGMGLVPGGQFERDGLNVALRMWNANNHQLTWRVVGLVVSGLLDFINKQEGTMAPLLVMQIFDGDHQVGEGQITITGRT